MLGRSSVDIQGDFLKNLISVSLFQQTFLEGCLSQCLSRIIKKSLCSSMKGGAHIAIDVLRVVTHSLGVEPFGCQVWLSNLE